MTRSPVFSSFPRKGFAQPESLPQATAVSSSCQQLSSANAQGTVGFTRSELPWFGVKATLRMELFKGASWQAQQQQFFLCSVLPSGFGGLVCIDAVGVKPLAFGGPLEFGTGVWERAELEHPKSAVLY